MAPRASGCGLKVAGLSDWHGELVWGGCWCRKEQETQLACTPAFSSTHFFNVKKPQTMYREFLQDANFFFFF